MTRFSSHGVTDLLTFACLEIDEGYLWLGNTFKVDICIFHHMFY